MSRTKYSLINATTKHFKSGSYATRELLSKDFLLLRQETRNYSLLYL